MRISSEPLLARACYATPLGDCDGGSLTKEHFISKSILREFGTRFVVEGIHWGTDGQSLASPASFSSKLLCKRHNNQLSALDDSMGTLYRQSGMP